MEVPGHRIGEWTAEEARIARCGVQLILEAESEKHRHLGRARSASMKRERPGRHPFPIGLPPPARAEPNAETDVGEVVNEPPVAVQPPLDRGGAQSGADRIQGLTDEVAERERAMSRWPFHAP